MIPYALVSHSESPDSTSVDLPKRNFLKTGATAALGSVVFGAAFTAPVCGVSKEKAVKYVGLVIGLSEEAVPLLNLLGARDIAILVDAKVIPALEKLKDALADVDVPEAGSALQTVRNVISGVRTALANLPDSPRRTTIMGILSSISILLLTIEAFIDSEMPVVAASVRSQSAKQSMTESINKVFEATKP